MKKILTIAKFLFIFATAQAQLNDLKSYDIAARDLQTLLGGNEQKNQMYLSQAVHFDYAKNDSVLKYHHGVQTLVLKNVGKVIDISTKERGIISHWEGDSLLLVDFFIKPKGSKKKETITLAFTPKNGKGNNQILGLVTKPVASGVAVKVNTKQDNLPTITINETTYKVSKESNEEVYIQYRSNLKETGKVQKMKSTPNVVK